MLRKANSPSERVKNILTGNRQWVTENKALNVQNRAIMFLS